tara:strand:+ start:766 stop:1251 length:486 start_codon:yes stop_codon:yes gene_type:complete
MKKTFLKIDQEFRAHWKHYVFQSFCAAIAIFLVLLVLGVEQAVIVAAIGASAFVVFAMPKSIIAKTRNVLGGYIVGIGSGAVFSLIPHNGHIASVAICALAVGCSIFIMVVTDTEHPPASGVTLGIASLGFSLKVAITILISAIILVLVHRFFRRHLKDLI